MPDRMLRNSRVEPRDRWVSFRVTDAEKELIKNAADDRDQATAELVRDALRRELIEEDD